MKPLTSRLTPKDQWVWPITILAIVLGFMAASARMTDFTRATRLGLLDPSQQNRLTSVPADMQKQFAQLSSEVAKLRDDNTKLENSLASQNGATKLLNENLQEVKQYAGLTDVEGPGIVVTLRDSQKPPQPFIQEQIIHDLDVLRVVNELWSSGAEAISINGQRDTVTTSIRCVGPTILVNDQPVASPVRIRAIGDPNTLMGAMNLPGGVLSEIKQTDPAMVQLEQVQMQVIGAFTGGTNHKFAKAVLVTK